MAYKFERLDVWERALDYIDHIHEIADRLPKHERYNLSDQMTRAANSIALNIAVQRLLPLPTAVGIGAQRDRQDRATLNRTASSASQSDLCLKRSPACISFTVVTTSTTRSHFVTRTERVRRFSQSSRRFAPRSIRVPPSEKNRSNTMTTFRSEYLHRM